MRLSSRLPDTSAFLFTLAIAPRARGASQCYYPSGNKANDVPCDPDADVSMCCGSRSACLSSGLCLIPGTGPDEGISFARGSCTDQSWDSPICPQRCQLNPLSATNSSAYNFGTGGVQVWECVGEGYADPGAFCCESRREKTECCRTPDAVFSLPGATPGNARAVQTFPLPDDGEVDTTDFITTRRPTQVLVGGADTARLEDNLMTSTTESSPSGRQTTTHWTPMPTPTAAGGGLDETASGGGEMSNTAKIGMGVGIGVGAAVLIAAALFAWYWMRTRAAVAAGAGTTTAVASSSGEFDSGTPQSELGGTEMLIGGAPKELGGRGIAEMHTMENRPVEMYTVPGATNWHGAELHGHGEHAPAEMYVWHPEPPYCR